MLYDLSPTLRPETPVWPGDTPFSFRLPPAIADGAAVNVSAITSTPHLGSHVDAPFHVDGRGETVAELSLEPFLGMCRAVNAAPAPLGVHRHVEGLDLTSPRRLLFKTESLHDRKSFSGRF